MANRLQDGREWVSASGSGTVNDPYVMHVTPKSVAPSVTFLYHQSTISTLNDQTVIAGVSGQKIVVKDIVVQNVSGVETTVTIKHGATSVLKGTIGDNEVLGASFLAGDEWRLPDNTGLVINLSFAGNHYVSIRYFLEAV